MTPENPPLPAPCTLALAALERDVRELPAEVAAHIRHCPPCAEARILWLALEESVAPEVPAGYFEALPFRIQRKLPARRAALKQRAVLWLVAAGLVGAVGMGTTGFFMGRAVRRPMVEAALAKELPEHPDAQAETPFAESEDAVGQLSGLSAAEAEQALQRLQAPKSAVPPK